MAAQKKPPKLRVVDPDKAVPVEVLAESIRTIAEGTRRLLDGPLKRSTIQLLIQHAAPRDGRGGLIGIREVERVLEGIENLKRKHCK